jgi:hypothetical protein
MTSGTTQFVGMHRVFTAVVEPLKATKDFFSSVVSDVDGNRLITGEDWQW